MSSSCVPRSAMWPSCTTMMQSALRMVERRCAMTKEVRPCSRVSSAFWIRISVWVSMEEVASSRIRILGSFSSARAKEMSCFWPVLRRLPRSLTSV